MKSLLVEVRSEELPVAMIAPALEALEAGILDLLRDVSHGPSRRFSTPRRICVIVGDVASENPTKIMGIIGPAMSIAWSPEGKWTPAAVGFARKNNVDVEDLVQVDNHSGVRCVAVQKTTGGERVVDIIAQKIEGVILGIPFKKSMHWYDPNVRWGRPIRQVVLTYGGELIPAIVAGVAATDAVTGHRLSQLPPARVSTADQYVTALLERHVMVDRDRRQSSICDGLLRLAIEHLVDVSIDETLLEEVTDLVEWPVPIAVTFAEELLHLPPRLLIESMRINQRMFPTTRNGYLTNIAFTVSNNPHGDADLIATGNRRVLAARFYDAKFFYAEDRKKSLKEHGSGLDKMKWVVGTMLDKQERVTSIAESIAAIVPVDVSCVREAASLCKSDLLTGMVGEFPELQGHIGRLCAEGDGLSPSVAMAIEEHYLPRHSGDVLPTTVAGMVVGLADRLDTIVQCFRVGKMPKADGDSLGLRRAAHGVVALLGMYDYNPTLRRLVEAAGGDSTVEAFVIERLRNSLKEAGHSTSVVDAVLASGCTSVWEVKGRVTALDGISDLAKLVLTAKRVHNVASKAPHIEVYDVTLLDHPSSVALAEATMNDPVVDMEYLLRLSGLVDKFFVDVLVFSGDHREPHKIRLLQDVDRLFSSYADFKLISR